MSLPNRDSGTGAARLFADVNKFSIITRCEIPAMFVFSLAFRGGFISPNEGT